MKRLASKTEQMRNQETNKDAVKRTQTFDLSRLSLIVASYCLLTGVGQVLRRITFGFRPDYLSVMLISYDGWRHYFAIDRDEEYCFRQRVENSADTVGGAEVEADRVHRIS